MNRSQHKSSTNGRRLSKPKAEMLQKLRFAAARYERSGEGGIRTRGGVSPTQHFQCCTFGRSVTSPDLLRSLCSYLSPKRQQGKPRFPSEFKPEAPAREAVIPRRRLGLRA